MAVLRAYLFPHPPLAVPAVGRGQERGIERTLEAFNRAAAEIRDLGPETILFITPHSVVYADYFHISPGKEARGDLSRFHAKEASFNTLYDEELIEVICEIAEDKLIPAGTMGERDASLDHGIMVPMWFINKSYTEYQSIRISPSGMDSVSHYRLGQCIAEAVNKTGRRVVIVASGDLSHKLTDDGPYGFAPEGPKFDAAIVKAFSDGDFLSLFTLPESLRERAAECGYSPIMVLAGCFDRQEADCEVSSYEGPFGVGYAVAGITPGKADEGRNFSEQYSDIALNEAQSLRETEDAYRNLARRSLEYMIKEGKKLPFPDDLPDELINQRAGAFVTLYKQGRLRGCIGTIAPTADSVAEEIIKNAVSAGLNDTRFDPVSPGELAYLTYKVDILGSPERIMGPAELDVKRYGVIVTCGHKRGLLLPNLDGIDSVEQQIAIARQKGGISERDDVVLERFEVTRHG